MSRVTDFHVARASQRAKFSAKSAPRASAIARGVDARRVAGVSAILALDARALAQLATTIDGRVVLEDMALDALARNVREFADALPERCQPWVFDMCVETPGLLHRARAGPKADVARVRDALGGDDALERLCCDCPAAFAHLFQALSEGSDVEHCARALREWARGEATWHRVFAARAASEWSYVRTLQLRERTSTANARGVVYRNVKTGEAIGFRGRFVG